MQNSGYTFKNKTSFLSSLIMVFILSTFVNNAIESSVYAASKEVNMSNLLTLSSSAFKQGIIPKQYTADGANVSPPLSWTGAQADTKSFALICEDPDAPAGTWIHWIVYDIPANKTN